MAAILAALMLLTAGHVTVRRGEDAGGVPDAAEAVAGMGRVGVLWRTGSTTGISDG